MKKTYDPFLARMVCYHEAGHVIVMHAIGWQILRASAGRGIDETHYRGKHLQNPNEIPHPERPRAIRRIREAMAGVAAGCIAVRLHTNEVLHRGYTCREEKYAYERKGWLLLLPCSFRYKFIDPVRDMTELKEEMSSVDESFLYRYANILCMAEDRRGDDELVHAKIVQAEEMAERLLKEHWQAVHAVADALHRSKSGTVHRHRLLALLGRHIAAA